MPDLEMRRETFRQSLAGIRAKSRRVDPIRLLLTLGSICLTVGFAFVFLAWYGMAHTHREAQQLPYLVSGGISGGVLCILSGLFFVTAVWLATLRRQERAQAERDIMYRTAIEELIDAVRANATSPASTNSARMLVSTKAGRLVHRPDCPMVVARADLRPIHDISSAKLCRVCAPDTMDDGAIKAS